MSDIANTFHINVWGMTPSGGPVVVGTISVDRAQDLPYMVQQDEESTRHRSDVAAAEWLADRYRGRLSYVLVGRLFRHDGSKARGREMAGRAG